MLIWVQKPSPFIAYFLCLVNDKEDKIDSELRDECCKDIAHLENRSILLALRNAIAPSVTGPDAVMFATLLSDFFPSHDIPLMFNQGHRDSLRAAESTIGLSLEKEEGSPLRLLPDSPQPQAQGKFYLPHSI